MRLILLAEIARCEAEEAGDEAEKARHSAKRPGTQVR
jgi:hypothetical protein